MLMRSSATPQAPGTGSPRRPWLQILVFLFVTVAYVSGSLEFVERKIMDLRFRLLETDPTDDLVIVAIDAPSLREVGVWPWPRTYHAELTDRLVEAGARRIVFDVDFSSPSSPEADERLEKALQAAEGRVALAAHKQIHRDPEGAELVYTLPLPRFRRHASIVTTNVRPEQDGIVRQMPVRDEWNDQPIPSIAALLAYQEDAPLGSFYVDFAIDPARIPRVSFSDVLNGRFDPGLFKGKQVIVGATAIELGDQLPVPIHKSLSGALFNGLGYQSLALDRALQRFGAIPILVIAGLFTMLVAPGFFSWSWRKGIFATAVSIAIIFAISVLIQQNFPVLFDVSPLMLVVLLLFPCGLISRIDQQSFNLFLQGIQLHRSNALMRSVVENSLDGILIIRQDGTVEIANAAAAGLFGRTESNLADTRIHALIPDLPLRTDATNGIVDIVHGHQELQGVRADGSRFPAEVATSETKLHDDRLFIAVVHDITERKKQQARLEHQAVHDALTDLPNRTLLADRLNLSLELAIREEKPLALLLLDLDRFKEVNDTLGHHVGDLLLSEVARRLPAELRKSDTVARLGGDEFAVLLPAVTDLTRAKTVAQRIARSLEEPFKIADLSFEVGVSIGIALYPDHAQDADRLLQCADVAMYMAKKAQSPFALYDHELDQNSVRTLALTGELRQAIEQNQLSLAYQPKIDLGTQKIRSMEALARWIHPVHGFIPPDEFVAQAELTGLIQPFTHWALETALGQLADLQSRGINLGMAVNLSTKNLHDGLLPKAVRDLLRKLQIPPERLTLEITESALMHDPENALENVHRLHEIGVHLSIDDFGTGFSSLSYLKQLPVDELKIDKSFVMQMHENESDAKIVRSTVNLAHDLGIHVVAEGIECEQHLQMLRDLGCDIGQGYFFSRPLPADQLIDWIDNAPWGNAGANGSGALATAT